MKNFQKSLLILSVPFLLTACTKSIDIDTFKGKLAEAEANLAMTSDKLPEQLHYDVKGNTSTYDYKEGSYYRHTTWGLILIVPFSTNTSTWEKDGHYFHYVYDSLAKKETYSEITLEQFNTYMSAGKEQMRSLFLEPINKTKELMSYEDGTVVQETALYSSVTNKYYAKGDNYFKIASKAVNKSDEETVTNFTIEFENGFVKKYQSVTGNSKTINNYRINYSQFSEPERPSDNTSESA